jgi:hypothetical protein
MLRPPLPITRAMSIESTLERVSAIRQAITDPAALVASRGAITGGTEAPAGSSPSFATALSRAGAAVAPASATTLATGAAGLGAGYGIAGSAYPLPGAEGVAGSAPLSSGSGPGARIVAIAEGQLGQAE